MTSRSTSSAYTGFSLLEMTIIIGILGLMIGAFVSFYQPTQAALGIAKSRQQVDRVLDALASFAMRNNRLPCPARPTQNNPNLIGVEDTGGGICGGLFPGQGIVPYRTLGLSQEDVQDGFQRYMTYIVRQPATIPTNTPADFLASTFCVNSSLGSINVFRRGVMETNSAFAAVIAHGAEGIGGYNMTSTNATARGTPIPDVANMGTFERQNGVDFGADRVDIADYSLQEGNNHFDDVVGYMTGFGVVSRLGETYCR